MENVKSDNTRGPQASPNKIIEISKPEVKEMLKDIPKAKKLEMKTFPISFSDYTRGYEGKERKIKD